MRKKRHWYLVSTNDIRACHRQTDQEILKNWISNLVRSMLDHPDTDTFVEELEDSCNKE